MTDSLAALLHIDCPCGGIGKCGKCRIKVNGKLSEPTDAYEWSFVAVPAQKNAGVSKSMRKIAPTKKQDRTVSGETPEDIMTSHGANDSKHKAAFEDAAKNAEENWDLIRALKKFNK